MAAKKTEVRISKRTGKPVRAYTKPADKPARRGRKAAAPAPRGRARTGERVVTEETPAPKRPGRRPRGFSGPSHDARIEKQGREMRIALEAAGLMVPGVPGLVLADAGEVKEALAFLANENATRERLATEAAAKADAEADRAKAEAAQKAAEKAAEKAALKAAKAQKAAEEAAAAAAPATPRNAGDAAAPAA